MLSRSPGCLRPAQAARPQAARVVRRVPRTRASASTSESVSGFAAADEAGVNLLLMDASPPARHMHARTRRRSWVHVRTQMLTHARTVACMQ